MSNKSILILFLFPLTLSITYSQPIWPLNCEPQLTSTFAEFRVGHFHAGIDLRTPDGEGMPIIAPGDGSIIRVRETPWGYGRVVYYQLQNEKIYVFAHLSRFNDSLHQIVLDEKLKNQSNTVEMWFKEKELTYSAGDTLAFSGSSGAGSPHLHFETRKSMNKSYNPFFDGYITQDTIAPIPLAVWFIPEGFTSRVKGSNSPLRMELYPGENSYSVTGGKISVFGRIQTCIEFYDKESDKNGNRFGVYSLKMIVDNDTLYNFTADSFSYSRTRQIGLLYDLGIEEEFELKRPPFRVYNPIGADLVLLKNSREGSGILDIQDTTHVHIELSDYQGQTAKIEYSLIPKISNRIPEFTIEEDSTLMTIIMDSTEIDISRYSFLQIHGEDTTMLNLNDFLSPCTLKMSKSRLVLYDTIDNCVDWFYKTELPKNELSIDYNLLGENLVINTIFHSEFPEIPRIRMDSVNLYPDQIDDSSFTFRINPHEIYDSLNLISGNYSQVLNPQIQLCEANNRYDLCDDRISIITSENGVFYPFYIRDIIIESDSLTPIFRIEPAGMVFNRQFAIYADPGTLFVDNQDKTCLVRIWNGNNYFLSSQMKEGSIFGEINSFGTFSFALDTLPPELEITSGPIVNYNLTANITDDLSGFSNNILPQSYIDSNWIPTDYDPEKNTISVDISTLGKGDHLWKIIATDNCGNTVTDSVKFNKSRG